MEKSKSQNLDFKPLTPGLGFHPFSDGLPYAPISKTGIANGSGAVVAGDSVYAGPEMRNTGNHPRKVQVPVADPVRKTQVGTQRTTRNEEVRPIVPKNKPYVLEPAYSLGYLAKRAFGYTLDFILNGSLFYLFLVYILRLLQVSEEVLFLSENLWYTGIIFFAFHWFSVFLQEMTFKTSIGKKCVGLRLMGSRSRIFLRSVLSLVSQGLLMLGILWSLFDSKKRAWHDLISGVQPHESVEMPEIETVT